MTIGKYKVTLRPHSSELALFAPGIRKDVTEKDVMKAFEKYGRIIDCTLTPKKNSPLAQNATINYANG